MECVRHPGQEHHVSQSAGPRVACLVRRRRIWCSRAPAFSRLVPQEKITVRWKTVSEIWAEIGALWAGATMIIGWFFVKSGFLDKHGREAQVFIYQSESMRKQQIAGLTAKGMVAIKKDESKAVATDVDDASSV